MEVRMTKWPSNKTWDEVKIRALVTVGKRIKTNPTLEWKKRILKARHSPIRYILFSFELTDIPSYVATHLTRHVHAQPYVRSQRNDRQNDYDRNSARQDSPVNMIWDINAEELMVIMNKRLCSQADEVTRKVVQMMKEEVLKVCPEFEDELVPMCEYVGECKEMVPCGRCS